MPLGRCRNRKKEMAKVFGLESFKDEMLVPFQFRSVTVQSKYYTSSLQADAGRAYGALIIRSSWPLEATKTLTHYHPILLLNQLSTILETDTTKYRNVSDKMYYFG